MSRARVVLPHDPGDISPTMNQAIIAQLGTATVSPTAGTLGHIQRLAVRHPACRRTLGPLSYGLGP